MKELLQRSWKKRGYRSRKEIFAAEVVRSILLHRMEDIWCLLKRNTERTERVEVLFQR